MPHACKFTYFTRPNIALLAVSIGIKSEYVTKLIIPNYVIKNLLTIPPLIFFWQHNSCSKLSVSWFEFERASGGHVAGVAPHKKVGCGMMGYDGYDGHKITV